MEIAANYIDLKVSDGTTIRAYVAPPKSSPARAGLILGQEAFGVNAHIRDVTERFAREGYLAVAPELFHRTGPGVEIRYDDFQSAMPHMRAMTGAGIEADIRACYDWLIAQHAANWPVVSVGFCMGGRVAFHAALTLPVRAAVSFYGGGIAPSPASNVPGLLNRAAELRAPLLFFWGGKDKHVTLEHSRAVVDALRAAGKSYVNVDISDADHGFFCDARPSYSPAAAAIAWPLTLAFLNTHIA
jgi:carboxymethylenebutenolidase